MPIWNTIVRHYHEKINAREDVLQRDWEFFFSDLFGYKAYLNEIDAHRTLPIGSGQRTIPDIIIKENETDLFDVELKQYSLPFSIEMENQLKSYLDLLHISIGVLICKNLYLYSYDYDSAQLKKIEIAFTENNPEGEEFISLFQKGNFSTEKVKAYIDQKKQFTDNVATLKNQLTNENALCILKKHFENKFSKEEIETAFENVLVNISKTVPHPHTVLTPPTPTMPPIAPIPPAGNGGLFSQVAKKILTSYHEQGKLIFDSRSGNSYIRFQTKGISALLPNIPQRGAWGLHVQYLFWLGEQNDHSFKACFELGGWNRDECAIQVMDKIIRLYRPNDTRPQFKYKRIHTVSYSYTPNNVEAIVTQAIDELLNWEKELLRQIT